MPKRKRKGEDLYLEEGAPGTSTFLQSPGVRITVPEGSSAASWLEERGAERLSFAPPPEGTPGTMTGSNVTFGGPPEPGVTVPLRQPPLPEVQAPPPTHESERYRMLKELEAQYGPSVPPVAAHLGQLEPGTGRLSDDAALRARALSSVESGQGAGQPAPAPGMDPRRLVNLGGTSSWQRSSQVTRGPGMLPGTKEAMQQSRGRVRQAADAQRAALDAQTKRREAAAAWMWADQKQAQMERADLESRRKGEFEKFQQKDEELRKEMMTVRGEKIDTHLDPSRVWSSMAGWQRGLLTLAAGQMEYANILAGRGGPNSVVQALEKMIERDLQIQQKAIDGKRLDKRERLSGLRERIDGLRSSWGMMEKEYGSRKEAMEARRRAMRDSLAQRLRMMSANTDDRMKAQALSIQAEQLEQKNLLDLNRLHAATADREVVTKTSSGSRRTGPAAMLMAKAKPAKYDLAPDRAVEGARSQVSGRRVAKRLQGYMKQYIGGGVMDRAGNIIVSRIPTTLPKAAQARFDLMAGRLAKQIYGGQITDREGKKAEAATIRAGDSDDAAAAKVQMMYDDQLGYWDGLIEVHPNDPRRNQWIRHRADAERWWKFQSPFKHYLR